MNLERQFLSFRWALGTTNQNCPNAISFYFAYLGEFLGSPTWQNFHIVLHSFFIWQLFFSWLVSHSLGVHIVPLQEWKVIREKGDPQRWTPHASKNSAFCSRSPDPQEGFFPLCWLSPFSSKFQWHVLVETWLVPTHFCSHTSPALTLC